MYYNEPVFQNIVGDTLLGWELSEDGSQLFIKTEMGGFVYEAEGDCCARAYMLQVDQSDIDAVIGSRIVSTSAGDVSTENEDGDTTDTQFYTIVTERGDIDIELRTEHNGYYGGWIRRVSG